MVEDEIHHTLVCPELTAQRQTVFREMFHELHKTEGGDTLGAQFLSLSLQEQFQWLVFPESVSVFVGNWEISFVFAEGENGGN